ncbi:uncharacterized protein SEPMUDRAFT_146910 [Sphaerulina musiva SO2202]|uniref:CT20-domain-containing protein n=1 Tax=Sphaerulina musiva (strain SO2202) TaxID=692275 RepID=M3C3P9_SPHMS|nr:uncharacterized protein SEPMUDRAFT_146910 [Sphaerulina musiva SO2202]EMF14876.1 hypothetical protein SEPMUDRAFT_146910 [Sphaerulina musiva SO2202]
MPPRKKPRPSPSPSTSRHKTPDAPPSSHHSASSPNKPLSEQPRMLLDDPWSDHEEIGLFKGLMIWKPTGMHKHFRLLALHAWLLQNNYIHPRNEHTKPKGIRTKLETLYNMDALDAREDARQLPAWDVSDPDAPGTILDDDIYSEAENRIEGDDFALPPGEGFEKEMWKRRLAPPNNREESDAELPELNLAEDPPVRFVATVSVEPSEAPTVASKKGKSAAAGARRKSMPKIASTTTRRSARQAESTADEEEATGEQEGEVGGAGGEEEDEGENSASENQSQASTPAPRTSSRSTRGVRGRGNARPARARGKK